MPRQAAVSALQIRWEMFEPCLFPDLFVLRCHWEAGTFSMHEPDESICLVMISEGAYKFHRKVLIELICLNRKDFWVVRRMNVSWPSGMISKYIIDSCFFK